jgi:hypothetical protein
MNWQIFQEIMEISTKWIQWTSTLYENARTNVLMNGAIRIKEFSMERVIGQGCPLAPYLYLLVANVLNAMLINPIHQVEGLTLHDGSILRDLFFVDDTTLFLNGSRKNLQHAFHFINLLCEGFGTWINWHKSCIVWTSHNP